MVMKIRATLTKSLFPKKIFTKALKDKLSVKHDQSVRVWLRRVLEETPSYTGTVKGTFKPVHRLVGRVKFPVIINKTGKTHFVYKGKKIPLGFEKGENYATAKMTEKDFGTDIEYSFIFTRDLLYAMWNEIQPAPSWMNLIKPTPWQALLKANESWGRYVRESIFKKLPPLSHSLKITKIKVR